MTWWQVWSDKSNGMNPKVLLVEDNHLNAELVTDLLEVDGFVVHRARSGEEAVGLARELLPNLILLDIGLPGMDGLAVTKTLRAEPETRGLMIIALTAHAMNGDKALALEAGCDGYLAKPIDTRTFSTTITGLIALSEVESISDKST
jgi:CheY-like chemotaxis protein